MAVHRMTPARRAALKKAQAASARKRRGKGRGKLAKANKQVNHYKRSKRRANIRLAAGVGLVAGAYVGAHALGRHMAKKQHAHTMHQNRHFSNGNYAKVAADHAHSKARMKHKMTHTHSGPANKHNRVFATSRHGTTSIRKRY